MNQIITSVDELQAWVNSFLENLEVRKDNATIITLSGELGVGKTAFVKCCARYFGISEDITSPTFVIQKEYDINPEKMFSKLVHIDAYRLTSSKELEYLKWEETISDPATIVFLEWPEMVLGIALPHPIAITLELREDHSRVITIT